MSLWKSRLLRTTLDTLYYTGAYRLLEPAWGGVGIIFTLHHIEPGTRANKFSPNRILSVTPEFLEQTIRQILDQGYDIVTLDQVRQRLIEKNFEKKFVCFTFDDGYLDNYHNAFPIFKKYNVPFTIYVTTGLCTGKAVLWWQHLEETIARENEITMKVDKEIFNFKTRTTGEKYQAFSAIYWALRQAPHTIQQTAIQGLIDQYHLSPSAACRDTALDWKTLKELSESSLVTIGAHTVNHYALSKLSAEEAADEAEQSRQILAQHLGIEPAHFTFPYGDSGSAGAREFEITRNLGFATATTTRKGVLFPEHANHLHALPRVSLNGDYQKQRYVSLFLSGTPFALWNRFNRLDVQ